MIILQLRGIPFLEEEAPESARHMTVRARHIMSPTVTLDSTLTIESLLGVLKTYDFSDFPVIDPGCNDKLLGTISRKTLLSLLSQKSIFCKNDPRDDGSASSKNVLTHQQVINNYPEVINKTQSAVIEDVEKELSREEKSNSLHITPYVQIAPHTFDGHGSAERAYEMFRTLGLRNLLVLDNMSRPIGNISRHELVLLEEMNMSEERFITKHEHMGVYNHG